ncbi:hypothetical protein HHK36_005677 [Tetracentron sinense]|uniref:DUF4408 domain-containing protein n=1 Tax=Tetracentron sinense TaxID=13715 RepID=A0A834ZLF6_TETSI|nr:hypothetical protein HHK36_005677 [Tetracentron sinense]
MDKSQKSQLVKLSFILVLLLVTPLLSTSMRPPYLYFLINLLIILLGTEAGLLSPFSKPLEDKKSVVVPRNVAVVVAPVVLGDSPDKRGTISTNIVGSTDVPECTERKVRVMEKSASEKIAAVVKIHKVKKCPSTPSLFFIGGGEANAVEAEVHEEEEEEVGALSGQELFTKAETFIGNFYKQLKMQREESWKRIHGLYHQAF